MEIKKLVDKIEEIEGVDSVIIQDYWEGDSLEGFVMVTITSEDGIEGDIDMKKR